MNTPLPPEIEATFIEIDKDKLRASLKSLGATLVQPEILMRRRVFDMGEHSFVRVRDEGNCITMSYKHLESHSLSGMKEICLKIDNYDSGVNFLKACGLREKANQESYREEWELDGVKVDIDTWPWIPSFVEIEGPSEDLTKSVAMRLGFDMDKAIYGSVDEIYKLYYDVTDHEVNFCPEISFSAHPDWIDRRR